MYKPRENNVLLIEVVIMVNSWEIFVEPAYSNIPALIPNGKCIVEIVRYNVLQHFFSFITHINVRT